MKKGADTRNLVTFSIWQSYYLHWIACSNPFHGVFGELYGSVITSAARILQIPEKQLRINRVIFT